MPITINPDKIPELARIPEDLRADLKIRAQRRALMRPRMLPLLGVPFLPWAATTIGRGYLETLPPVTLTIVAGVVIVGGGTAAFLTCAWWVVAGIRTEIRLMLGDMCPRCGYSRAGHRDDTARCPECGAAWTGASREQTAEDPRSAP